MILTIILLALAATAVRSQPAVRTALGTVLGSYCEATDNTVARFIGIPYAKPPVGNLRWRAPVKYDTPYPTGIYNATVPMPYCHQIPGDFNFYKATNQSEDCLFINVWTPAHINSSAKLPVRVYIHGGAFTTGGGIDPTYDSCQVVADGDVVAVTFNYRLGMLGFLALPEFRDAEAGNTTGNWGLLDQRLALQWVKDNIAAFGGDPRRVLIHGQSAGGSSVYFHMIMPMSKGLFSRAIIQSGASDYAAIFLKDAYFLGATMQDLVGCNQTRAAARGFASPRECLLNTSVQDIVSAQSYIEFVLGIDPGATVDGSPYAFPEHPYTLMKKGCMAHVPVLAGSNDKEGDIFVLLYVKRNSISPANMTQQQFLDFITSLGFVPRSFVDRLLRVYDPEVYGGYYNAASAAAGDVTFSCPTRRVGNAFSKHTPTYGYWMHEVFPNSGCGIISTLEITTMPVFYVESLGAYHTYELQFTFMLPYGTPAVRYNCTYTPNEAQMAAFMSGAWSSFAIRASLLPAKTHRLKAPQLVALKDWPRWTRGSPLVMNLNFTQPGPIDFSALYAERCAIWDDIMASAIKHGTHFPDGYPLSPPNPPSPTPPPPKRGPPKRPVPKRPPPKMA